MSPQSIIHSSNVSSGRNTPDSQLESIVPVHTTAARCPYGIEVASENTSYTDEFITSKYTVVTFVPRNLLEQFRRVANW